MYLKKKEESVHNTCYPSLLWSSRTFQLFPLIHWKFQPFTCCRFFHVTPFILGDFNKLLNELHDILTTSFTELTFNEIFLYPTPAIPSHAQIFVPLLFSSSLILISWLQPFFDPIKLWSCGSIHVSWFFLSALSSSSSLESLVHHCNQSFVYIHNSTAIFFLYHLLGKTPNLLQVISLSILSLHPSSGMNLVKTVITCSI